MAAEKDLNVGANLYPTESGVAELGNSSKKWIIDGSQLTGTVTATTATTATKLGSSTVGSATKPIYLNGGTATACSSTVGGAAKPVYMNGGTITACSSTIGGAAKPAYMNAGTITACSSTVGSATKPVYMNAGTITAGTYTLEKSVPSSAVFTDTHYTSKNVVGTSTATSNTTSALANGNVYLNSVENGAVTSAHKISGSGATTVTTDTSGNIVVSSTNTTYSSLKNPNALTISLNGTSQGAYDGSSAKSINITASAIGAAASSHDHNRVTSKGNHAETASGTTANAPTAGMADTTASMYMTQNNSDSSTPASYGNIINLVGAGTGQLMAEWSGSDSTTGHLYYRSHRDTSTGGWGAWNTIIDSANISSQSVKYATSAGSATSATSATTATALSTSAGSATQPVYFSSGKPVACSYTIAKSVPSNAVFTDTNTWTALKGSTTSAAGTAGYVPAPAAGAATRYLRCDGTWTVPPDTNTTYSAATTSAAGLMSAADKTKLDGIATGANAYTLPTATSSVLGGVKIGSNITVSSGTISLTKANVTSALGYTPPTTNTTYSVATTSANGLMSSTDKSKLDNLSILTMNTL